jgi:hypothetical protein
MQDENPRPVVIPSSYGAPGAGPGIDPVPETEPGDDQPHEPREEPA